ncbi:MAG: MoxR family ATPase [Solirubrobacteraceae bacterium]|jgi:MoxR-like ATPase
MIELRERVNAEVARVVVAGETTVDALLASLVLGGHVLLQGPPGVAKTLSASAFARAVGGQFHRVQFTSDMLPSDLTGTMTLQAGKLQFRPGPVFANVLLADEINRTPPKTQAALLEAMQEGQVSVDGVAHPLPEPFLVVATQNPIEFEGTYPLPEAQLDRFLMRVEVGYPSEDEERELVELERDGLRDSALESIAAVVSAQDIAHARKTVADTTVSPDVSAYLVAVVRSTRELPSVSLGASPRAAVHLRALACVLARYSDRDFVTPDDIARAVPLVLAHRLQLSPDAELDRYSAADALEAALASVPVPR